jgi:hypothetical protein
MVMKKLSDDALPLTTFKRCQLCGSEKSDIVEFTMWWECDENDEIDPEKILVTCRSEACGKTIDDHERLYREISWGRGGPGKFMLLCGNCINREGTRCTHPNLRANGGNGLKVTLSNLPKAIVCFHENSKLGCVPMFPDPATRCEGLIEREKMIPDVMDS